MNSSMLFWFCKIPEVIFRIQNQSDYFVNVHLTEAIMKINKGLHRVMQMYALLFLYDLK